MGKNDCAFGLFVKRWLLGSTCHNHKLLVFWKSGCGNYVIMKHHGHSEYIGRFSPIAWCRTYYALYDIRERWPDCLGGPSLRKWVGRWNKKNWKEVRRLCGFLKDESAGSVQEETL